MNKCNDFEIVNVKLNMFIFRYIEEAVLNFPKSLLTYLVIYEVQISGFTTKYWNG